MPYRDFHQLYGPSLFALNGALFALFGATLWPVRLGLLAAKTAAVVLTYAAARRLAGPSIALAVAALATAIWGLPIWLFNAPYASHYATAWLLAALFIFPPLEKGGEGGFPNASPPSDAPSSAGAMEKIPPCPPFSKGGYFVAGVCLGVAATFKQTTGVLLLIGLGLALFALPGERTAARRVALADAICAAFLVAAAAVVLAYLQPGPPLNGALLAAPLAGLFGLAASNWRRLDRDATAAALLALAAGAALPLLACAAVFAAAGGLGDLLRDTLTELPRAVRWFTPLRPPGSNAGWLLLAVGAALALSMP
ncbi:MAG: hypothetical protein SF182_28595, partial [Deltaproteobacteria bacterium]|nr:hypothetical protein [Deltaproteobacteria bacterium]